jgi:hypothetical protein
MQGIFRSNYALIGIPLATSLFSEEGAAVATLLSAIMVLSRIERKTAADFLQRSYFVYIFKLFLLKNSA